MYNEGKSLSTNDIDRILERLGYKESVEISKNDLGELLRGYSLLKDLQYIDIECDSCGETLSVEV